IACELLFCSYRFANHLLLRTVSCKTPDPVRTLCCPLVCRRTNVSMNSRSFLPRGPGASCRNRPVRYPPLAKTVHSTFSPSNAVLVVANRATELEGNDARNKEKDWRRAMAGGRTRRGGRERGHAACSAETNDGGRAEGEVGKPLRHACSEQQPQLPRAEAQLPGPGTDPRRPVPRDAADAGPAG